PSGGGVPAPPRLPRPLRLGEPAPARLGGRPAPLPRATPHAGDSPAPQLPQLPPRRPGVRAALGKSRRAAAGRPDRRPHGRRAHAPPGRAGAGGGFATLAGRAGPRPGGARPDPERVARPARRDPGGAGAVREGPL